MEVDTGAAVTIVSEEQFRRDYNHEARLVVVQLYCVYAFEIIPMLGEVQLNVKYKGQSYTLTAYITKRGRAMSLRS